MTTDVDFVKKLNACPLSDSELADKISVSLPTVGQWKQGKNLPHPALMEGVMMYLEVNF